jgi:hypothetical protein
MDTCMCAHAVRGNILQLSARAVAEAPHEVAVLDIETGQTSDEAGPRASTIRPPRVLTRMRGDR